MKIDSKVNPLQRKAGEADEHSLTKCGDKLKLGV